MIIFTLKRKCLIEGAGSLFLRELAGRLTLVNPVFSKKMDLQLSIFGIPKFLKFYEVPTPKTILIPIGAIPIAKEILEKDGIEPNNIKIIDKRFVSKDSSYFSKISFTGKLRDYQLDSQNACLSNTNGIIEAMTGSGKTVVFVSMTLARKQPTLILVNTIELVNQTINSFVNFTNISKESIGFIGSGKFIVKPITIGLHQTMARLSDEQYEIINKNFSQVIADEVQ